MRTTYLTNRGNIPKMSSVGERIGDLMCVALRHPFGLTLLTTSIILAVLVRLAPWLDTWSGRWWWVLLLGVVAYAASVIAVRRTRPVPSEPEMRELYSIHQFMEAKLAERKAARGSGASQLTQILSEAIAHLDTQVMPALQELLERERDLGKLLARYESGDLPTPEPAVFQRLEAIHARQRAAIDECVQQASNAAATLVALLQEGDEATVASQARTWAGDLLNLYDAIAEVLRGEVAQSALDELYEHTEAERTPSARNNGPSPGDLESDGQFSEDFSRLVQEAMRQLNNPAALSTCELVSRLTGTLAAARSQWDNGAMADLMPLEQAQALREALVSAIEWLKPNDENFSKRPGAPGALQYHILHEQYVQKRPIGYIMTRYSISESTFHRNRREAVAAIARHLQSQEEMIAAEPKRRQ